MAKPNGRADQVGHVLESASPLRPVKALPRKYRRSTGARRDRNTGQPIGNAGKNFLGMETGGTGATTGRKHGPSTGWSVRDISARITTSGRASTFFSTVFAAAQNEPNRP